MSKKEKMAWREEAGVGVVNGKVCSSTRTTHIYERDSAPRPYALIHHIYLNPQLADCRPALLNASHLVGWLASRLSVSSMGKSGCPVNEAKHGPLPRGSHAIKT